MDNEAPGISSTAPSLIGIGTTLQIISLILVAIRISTRTRYGKPLFAHDWAVILAEVGHCLPRVVTPNTYLRISQILSIPQLVLVILATTYGYGLPTPSVPLENIAIARRYVFVSQVAWYWSCTLVKISVALLLLSLRPHNTGSRLWRLSLYTTIAVLILSLLLITGTQFLACLPIAAYWDLSIMATAKCWPVDAIAGTIITFSTVNIAADVVFTCMPLAFLVRLNQPRWQRVVIAVLMSLGLFSSVIAIFRTVVGLEMYPEKDQFRSDAQTSFLALVELHVGVVAATLPTLKSFFQRLLERLKISVEQGGPNEEEVWNVFVRMGFFDCRDVADNKRLDVENEKGVV